MILQRVFGVFLLCIWLPHVSWIITEAAAMGPTFPVEDMTDFSQVFRGICDLTLMGFWGLAVILHFALAMVYLFVSGEDFE